MPLRVGAVPSFGNDTDKPPAPKAFCVMSRKIPDSEIIGKKFGRYTPVKFVGINGFGRNAKRVFECKCDCGVIKNVWLMSLMSGQTKSCGCHIKPYKSRAIDKYGVYHNHLRHVYAGMISRCYNTNNDGYKNYGGRGITVCKRWVNNWFDFYCWAIDNGWQKGLPIDRRDNNKGYSPANCRIVTRKINARNTRQNKVIEFNGISLCLTEWAEKMNISESSLRYRLSHGWPIEQALTSKKGQKINPGSKSIKVNQMDYDGRFIKQYKSIKEAANTLGIDASTIAKVIKGRFKTCGGFKWSSVT